MSDLDPADERGKRDDDDVHAGDLVRTGTNQHPYFEVLVVKGDKVWVRDVASGVEQIIPRHRVHRIAPSLP
jgi:hypothetical protein